MNQPELAAAIFADARVLYADALEMLESGKLRNAAEKAWGATKRATDALIIACGAPEPRTTRQTALGLRTLAKDSAAFSLLKTRYNELARELHGRAFYDGICEPEDALIQRIISTEAYIRDAEDLAQQNS